jgi:putative membrane protein
MRPLPRIPERRHERPPAGSRRVVTLTVLLPTVLLPTLLALLGWPGVAAAAPLPGVSAQDQAFLRGAHQWHLAEISSGRFGERKGTEKVTKSLAARWINDHTRLDNALRPLARQLGVNLPAVPNATQQATLSRYQRSQGAVFDGLWVSTQRQSITDARRLVESELAGGSNTRVKQLAAQTLAVVRDHDTRLDDAAPALGAAPGKVDAGNGISAGTRPRDALILAMLGMALLIGSGLWLRRERVPGRGE